MTEPLLPDPPAPASGSLLCPSCGTSWPPDTLLCVRCGVNLHTGERVGGPPPDKPPEEEMPPDTWADVVPGLFTPRVLVISVVVLAMSLACFGLCILLLLAGVLMTAATAGAVGLILYAQAVAWILTGELQLLVNALADFDGRRWNAFFIALAVPLTLAFVAIGLRPTAE